MQRNRNLPQGKSRCKEYMFYHKFKMIVIHLLIFHLFDSCLTLYFFCTFIWQRQTLQWMEPGSDQGKHTTTDLFIL